MVLRAGAITPNVNPAEQRPISFWPTGNKKLFDSTTASFNENHLEDYKLELGDRAADKLSSRKFAPLGGQIVIGVAGNGDDVWGKRPEVIVSVPALSSARQTRLGINLNKMIHWAIHFKHSTEFNYTFVSRSQNCAGVVVRALVAGGGDAFAVFGGNHAKGNIYMTPNDAQRWSEAVLRGITEVNRMLEVLRNATAHLPPGRTELMLHRDWKRTSAASWTIRGSQTRTIDKALETYHQKNWLNGYPAKLEALVSIIHSIREHMRRESKRDAAYLELANQVVGVVGLLARGADEPWAARTYSDPPD